MNSELRRKATNKFESDCPKLTVSVIVFLLLFFISYFLFQANSFYGKTVENVWNYSDYRLVTKARDFHRLSRQLNFKRCEIVTPESCVIELQKTNVVLSKPRYVGVAVLGISKYLMGDFHYNYIMKNFDPKQKGRNVKLLMTDTDSFVYDLAFPPQVVYPMLRKQIAPYMDFSNYNQSMRYHHYYDPSRKCVPGYFKDENNGNFILEFAGIFLPLKLDHQIIFFFIS